MCVGKRCIKISYEFYPENGESLCMRERERDTKWKNGNYEKRTQIIFREQWAISYIKKYFVYFSLRRVYFIT